VCVLSAVVRSPLQGALNKWNFTRSRASSCRAANFIKPFAVGQSNVGNLGWLETVEKTIWHRAHQCVLCSFPSKALQLAPVCDGERLKRACLRCELHYSWLVETKFCGSIRFPTPLGAWFYWPPQPPPYLQTQLPASHTHPSANASAQQRPLPWAEKPKLSRNKLTQCRAAANRSSCGQCSRRKPTFLRKPCSEAPATPQFALTC
jgi:hypothetical protein